LRLELLVDALREGHIDQTKAHQEALKRLQAEHDRLQQRLHAMNIDKLDGRVESDFSKPDGCQVAVRVEPASSGNSEYQDGDKSACVRADRRCLFLPDSKTGEKVVRLSDEALDVLGRVPLVAGNPFVITGHIHGSHLTHLYKAWYLICARPGIDGVRIHDLRHSFASMAADAGASLPMIGGLLGHADPQTTARYVHLVDKRLHELNGVVGASIGAAMRGVASANGER